MPSQAHDRNRPGYLGTYYPPVLAMLGAGLAAFFLADLALVLLFRIGWRHLTAEAVALILALLNLAAASVIAIARIKVTLYADAIEVTSDLRPNRRLKRDEIAGRRSVEGTDRRSYVELCLLGPDQETIRLPRVETDSTYENWLNSLPDLDAGYARAAAISEAADQTGRRAAGQRNSDRTAKMRHPFARSARFHGSRLTPVTWLIIGSCVLVRIYQSQMPDPQAEAMLERYGAHPALILFSLWPWNASSPGIALSLFTSMFMHVGFGHLLLNMLFFYTFSVAVEKRMGSLRFAVFYLLCGLIATLTHVLFGEWLSLVPMVGASGAVAGVLGAHALLLPWDRLAVRGSTLPAWQFIVFWLVLQFFTGWIGETHIAWLAHVGGAVVGALLTPIFRKRGVVIIGSVPADEPHMDWEYRPPSKDGRPRWLPELDVPRRWAIAAAAVALVPVPAAVALVHTIAHGQAAILGLLPGLSSDASHKRQAEAQRERGAAYFCGEDAHVKDYAEGVRWFRLAAERGYGPAQNDLGFAYSTGMGVLKDAEVAAQWYGKAAAQGYARARHILGVCYEKGRRVRKGNTKAAARSTLRQYQMAQDRTRQRLDEIGCPPGG